MVFFIINNSLLFNTNHAPREHIFRPPLLLLINGIKETVLRLWKLFEPKHAMYFNALIFFTVDPICHLMETGEAPIINM